MTSIRSWSYAAGLLACLSGILFTTDKPTTDLGTSFHFAADTTGRRVDLTDWLMDRAERILPTAAPESLPAYLGSDPAPTRTGTQDPRVGVHSFKPISVQLAHWRPGITFWCSVPCNGSYRPLAMQVPLDEILAHLRQRRCVH